MKHFILYFSLVIGTFSCGNSTEETKQTISPTLVQLPKPEEKLIKETEEHLIEGEVGKNEDVLFPVKAIPFAPQYTIEEWINTLTDDYLDGNLLSFLMINEKDNTFSVLLSLRHLRVMNTFRFIG